MHPSRRRPGNRLALALLLGTGLGLAAPPAPVFAATATQQDAVKASVAAGQILYDKGEYVAVRNLLRAHTGDDKAALLYVRAGLASNDTTAEDFAIVTRMADVGSAVAARIKGDMLRDGTGVAVDYVAAEAAYRRAITLGDERSRDRLAGLFAQTRRYPEAIAAYAELRDTPAREVPYVVLSITKGGIQDPARLTALVDRLHVLSQTEAAAARAAASIYESGQGVPQDSVRAVAYARQAIDLGDTRLGLMVAEDCDTCSAIELVNLLKATDKLDDPARTSRALEKPLTRGLYEDAWEIVARFPPEDRTAIVQHMVERFGALSNPVVGLTQALMRSEAAYDGSIDGMLTRGTLSAIQQYGAARNIALVTFDEALVTALFTSSQ